MKIDHNFLQRQGVSHIVGFLNRLKHARKTGRAAIWTAFSVALLCASISWSHSLRNRSEVPHDANVLSVRSDVLTNGVDDRDALTYYRQYSNKPAPQNLPANLAFMLVLFILFIIAFTNFYWRELRKEFLRNQCSWPYYAYWISGLTLGWLAFNWWLIAHRVQFPGGIRDMNNIAYGSLYLAFLLGLYWFLKRFRHQPDRTDWRFAPDTAIADELGYKAHAAAWAKRIREDQSPVAVYMIDGEQGQGKSTFARMLVESFGEPADFLYTYISLTETNQENDLAKLFAERWEGALAARYPRMSFNVEPGGIDQILRLEERRFSLRSLLSILKRFDFAVSPTISCDGKRACSPGNARLFGHIPRISESAWLIVFDEIDRGLPREIFKAIEIVERLRHTQQNGGLPVRLCLVFCVATRDLEGALKNLHNTSDSILAHHIANFFSLKTPDSVISMPFVPFENKRRFVNKSLAPIYAELPDEKACFDQIEEGELRPDPYEQPLAEKELLSFCIDLLAEETPRLIKKCVNSARRFRDTFWSRSIVQYKVVFGNFIMMEYIKIKYPFLIDFMRGTIDEIFPKGMQKLDPNRLMQSLRKNITDRVEEKKKAKDVMLQDWIKDQCPAQRDVDVGNAALILAALCYRYIEHQSRDSEKRTIVENSFSNPWLLRRYLSIDLGVPDPVEQAEWWYQEHSRNGFNFEKIKTPQNLIQYSEVIRKIRNVPKRIITETASEISRRLLARNEVPFIKFGVFDTLRFELSGELKFLLLEILESQPQYHDKRLTEDTEKILRLFIQFLKNDQIETGLKISLLSPFVRGNGPTHFRFEHAYKLISECNLFKDFKVACQHVCKEFNDRYIDKKQSIFESEENIYYVLYQMWSGRNDAAEIGTIQQIVLNGLNEDVIRDLWKFINPRDVSLDYLDLEDGFSLNSPALYMPLPELIKHTRKLTKDQQLLAKATAWETRAQQGGIDFILNVKATNETLKYALLTRGLAEGDPEVDNPSQQAPN